MATLTVETEQFDRAQRLLSAIKGGVEVAASRAINDTLRAIRASAVRKIKAKLNVKAKDIRQRIALRRATRRIQRGSMTVKGAGRLPLFLFGAKPRKTGVSYKVAQGGQRQLIPGAFIVEGIPQVFVRRFTTPGGPRVGRLPIHAVLGPSVARIFDEEVKESIEVEAADKLAERLDFHVGALLRKEGL